MDSKLRHHYEVIQEVIILSVLWSIISLGKPYSTTVSNVVKFSCSYFTNSILLCSQGLPCHLYFDLEFDKKVNVGKDGDEMVDLLISTTLEALNEKYLICGDQEWIVELDSSTDGMHFS